MYVHPFYHVEVVDRLSDVPHHSGVHVPYQNHSTEKSNKAESSQIKTRQDTNALAGKLNVTRVCMFVWITCVAIW